jgi:hypothetical protein
MPTSGSDRFKTNINDILKFCKENKPSEHKLLITKDQFYVFEIEKIKQNVHGKNIFEHGDLIRVKDLDVFEFKDFEFMQRKAFPENSFVLKPYNKFNENEKENTMIEFECFDSDQFFVTTHLIEMYLPNFWKKFFEQSLEIKQPDIYQYHCFVRKKNRFGMLQPRFFVCSSVFMYNTECKFNKKGEIEFIKMNWIVPIEAIALIEVTHHAKQDTIEMKMHIDKKQQDNIVKSHNLPDIKKVVREVQFEASRKTAARDFLWHLQRIHHWWNFGQKMKEGKTTDLGSKL